MLPNGGQCLSQIDNFQTIQTQGLYCGPAGWRAPKDKQEVIVPGKMSGPKLAAGIEKWNEPPGQRIAGVSLIIFMTIACRASPGQFGQGISGTGHPRPDVLADERCGGISAKMATVLAAVTGAIAHQP